ncbi:hypothetical protein [Streptomyces viridochromogenes]|uniref:Metallo-beta-lactamase domain-containing protein n=1 Tax=Streptomyces viridochromogenes Tue57 TaxID=1160705 RepID=L8PQ52_STRVR|nr:hypothetical protein [Streptomyces viridochromogenes]ELS58234.1 hypothetical protein STVIR_0785 [Streptomyces viridochromogenes Tue57]
MNIAACRVDLIHIGSGILRGPEALRGQAFDEWRPIAFYVWLVRGPQGTALIDTGITADAHWWDARAKQVRGPQAYWRATDDADPTDALLRLGVAASDVDHVVLTSFGPYAASNVTRFPTATVHVSDAGLAELCKPAYPELLPSLPQESRAFLTSQDPRIRRFSGQTEVMPGLRVREIGGHHRESLAAIITTAQGDLVIPESVFLPENLQPHNILGIGESVYELLDTLRWLDRLDALVLPIHDPQHLTRFPDGVVAPAEPHPAPRRPNTKEQQ